MKKVLVIALAVVMALPTMAQKTKSTAKSDFKKAFTALNDAIKDPKAINYEKVDEAWTLIQPCMTDPATASDPEVWVTAGRCQVGYMQRMLNERAANGGQFKDNIEFFDNQEMLVQFFSKADELFKAPDEKGKTRKPEEIASQHTFCQQNAVNPRNNLLIAGNMLMESDPAKSRHYLDDYFATFSDPLFAEMNYAETDSMQYDAYLFYAASLMNEKEHTAADTLQMIKYFEKALDSRSNGKVACIQLMQIYHEQGDMENWSKYCKLGVDKYPDEPAFLVNLLNHVMTEKDFTEASRLSDMLIERFPEKDYGYYQKAAILYQEKKLPEALTAFQKAAEVDPESVDAQAGIGNTAWMLAQNNAADKETAKKYYAQAIEAYEHAHEMAPDRDDIWGYPLYAIYNNSGNAKKAAEYKQYNK